VFHSTADYEHPLLCLPGIGIASQETAISGSFQQILVCTFVSVYMCVPMPEHMLAGSKESRRGHLIPLELEVPVCEP